LFTAKAAYSAIVSRFIVPKDMAANGVLNEMHVIGAVRSLMNRDRSGYFGTRIPFRYIVTSVYAVGRPAAVELL